MKRLFAAVFFALLTLVLCGFGRATAENKVAQIQQSVSRIDRLLQEGSYSDALSDSETFVKEWEDIHDALCVFLHHDALDALERSFALLPNYIRMQAYAAAMLECRSALDITDHILKTEKITLSNLL